MVKGKYKHKGNAGIEKADNMKNWNVVLALVLAGLMGCGREESQPATDAAKPEAILKPAAKDAGNAISVALKHYIVTTDERLKEHVIQVAGLKFMGESDPTSTNPELKELTVWLEDSLASAKELLKELRVAPADRSELIKTELEALIDKMDERYEVAVGLAQGAYKSEVDTETPNEAAEEGFDRGVNESAPMPFK